MDFTLQKPAATLEDMPVEIMNLIIEAMVPVPAVIDSASDCSSDDDKAHDDFILNAHDVSALRLASRTLESTTLDAFTRRFFTVRKHMLSKASITCLSQIASCPKFSSVVHEVAIGPERINSGLTMFMGVVREEYTKNWKREAQGNWQALVDEQHAFDASGQANSMLGNALKGFTNLKHVRIDTYPDNKGDNGADWSKAWGAKSMMRQAGFALLYHGDYCGLSARFFLLEEADRVRTLHGHYAKVLEALNAIQDKDWTLELGFNAMNLLYETEPFDLARAIGRRIGPAFVRSLSVRRWMVSSTSFSTRCGCCLCCRAVRTSSRSRCGMNTRWGFSFAVSGFRSFGISASENRLFHTARFLIS
jgi:hypothetical protein